MSASASNRDSHRFLARGQLQQLLDLLRAEGYGTLGPQQRDGAIVMAPIDAIDQLPKGVSDRHGPGHYRLEQGSSQRLFAWANGPQALKPLLFAPTEKLWRYERGSDGRLSFTTIEPPVKPTAVVGVRACDLAALKLQDAHFLQGDYLDSHYRARRESLFIIAVDCTHPSASCFCASTGDGPSAVDGYDLAMIELDDGFLLRGGSERGRVLMALLSTEAVTGDQFEAALQQQVQATTVQQRKLPNGDLQQHLADNLRHPHWQRVAERCLSCGNCTSVCPTCFCHSERDEGALDGSSGTHLREWGSCFSHDHSYIHGLVVREAPAFRYRQWLTHKLSSWHDQYGRSGCVGCGRCISWCPVGIDLTEEVATITAECICE